MSVEEDAPKITYVESFDRTAAATLIKYKQHYMTWGVMIGLFETMEAAESSFRTLTAYVARAKGANKNQVEVSYSQKHGRGRYFADGGLSLQSLKGIIRGSIAKDLYYDIDFVNCHPVILIKLCKERGIKPIFLTMYMQDRAMILSEIHEANPSIAFDELKSMILSIIYGGNTAISKITNKTEWLNGFIKEMASILEKAPAWYPEEYKLQVGLKGEGYFNLNGATLSASVQVIENELLMMMAAILKTKKCINSNCVLTFDGIMVPKKSFRSPEKLEKVMREVEKAFSEKGYEIKLKSKEFRSLPELSDDKKAQLDAEYAEENKVAAESKRVELLNSDGFETPRDRYLSSPYYWHNFVADMSDVHPSYDSLCNTFRSHVGKVMIRAYEMDDMIIRKISSENLLHFDKTVPREVFSYMTGDLVPKVKNIPLKSLMLSCGLINDVPAYDKLDFQPIGPFESREECEAKGIINDHKFNTYTNLQATLLPADQVDASKIEAVLHHIKKVWADDDETLNTYLLSWFHTIFTKPRFKSRVAIVLKSSEKQIGKGIIINDFLIPFVFGNKYSMSIAGLDTVVSRFNDIMMNKIFISCDELSTIDGGYHQSFDVLKKLITDPTIKIEIKNGRIFIYPNYSNFIMSTNHDFTIKIEVADARYLVLECNPYYKRNFKYFENLAATFNQETADHFYSYICHAMFVGGDVSRVADVRAIPMTTLKKDMIFQGLQSPVRFMMYLKKKVFDAAEEEQTDSDGALGSDDEASVAGDTAASEHALFGVRFNPKRIGAGPLYDMYKRWCTDNQEKIVTSCKFGRDIKDYIKKVKSNRTYYDLSTFEIRMD